jgi:hypothetical protein
MSSLLRLDPGLSSRRMSCVLDGEFAFSRQGLLFASRLAQEADVWLFRALWQALDNSYIFNGEEDEGREPGTHRYGAFPSPGALQQWEMARLETDLTGLQFFFVGDARHESLLPKEVGKDLVRRFELFSEELDALHQRSGLEPAAAYDPIYECRRDAAALAAALMRHRPFVLSLCRRDGERSHNDAEPPLCDFLRRCGIDCRLVDAEGAAAIRSHFEQVFARSGLAELVWDIWRCGQDLASVHLVAPNALVAPIVDADSDRGFAEEVSPGAIRKGDAPLWFREAKAYWWKYA